MNSLTPEQIARVFAMYIGQRMSFSYKPILRGVSQMGTGPDWELLTQHGFALIDTTCKLLLRPLSAITDEHATEIARILWKKRVERDGLRDITTFVKRWVEHLQSTSWINAFAAFQFLIQRGYACPLWIAPGHPDNGKTAIQMGIAIASDEN